MYIDPKDLSLQDAAGMQLANLIRNIPEGGGDGGTNITLAELTYEESLSGGILTCNKTCAELIDKDVIIFYDTRPKRTNYCLCVCKSIPPEPGTVSYQFIMFSPDSTSFITLSCNNLTDFPSATVEE